MSIKEKPVIEKLGKHHDRESFSCGVRELDTYIRKQASQDSRRKVARVFVATLKDRKAIAGYYTLSAASIELSRLPEKIKCVFRTNRSVIPAESDHSFRVIPITHRSEATPAVM